MNNRIMQLAWKAGIDACSRVEADPELPDLSYGALCCINEINENFGIK